MLEKIKRFFIRWHDQTMVLPFIVIIAILAYVFLGSENSESMKENLGILSMLPIKTAYAVAALALAWMARRRFRRKLTDPEQAAFWTELMAGNRGPIIIFLTESAVFLCVAKWLIGFFSLPA